MSERTTGTGSNTFLIDTSLGIVGIRRYGEDRPNPVVVVCAGLCSPGAEWWDLAETVSRECGVQVLVYDRPGYGRSFRTETPRTAQRAALECMALLGTLQLNSGWILIGHGLGGHYMKELTRLRPADVRGLILVDPWSAQFSRLREGLAWKLYEGSGIDRTRNLRYSSRVSAFPLKSLVRRVLFNAAPYHGFSGFSAESAEELMRNLTCPGIYRTALEEYRSYQENWQAEQLLFSEGRFPRVPLRILYHDPETVIKDRMLFGRLNLQEARTVEALWRELTEEQLKLSDDSRLVMARHSGHDLHLTEPDLVVNAVLECVNR